MHVMLVVSDDGGLNRDNLAKFYQGEGIKIIFDTTFASAAKLKSTIVVTASSGIDRELLPTKAKYLVHMPHSLASLHLIYPKGTFNGYDVLFACGPQHVREFMAMVEYYNLKNKKIEKIGYGKHDVLKDGLNSYQSTHSTNEICAVIKSHILIAPSWGPDNLLDKCGLELAKVLVENGFKVTVRPHPLFFLEASTVVYEIKAFCNSSENCELESPMDTDDAIYSADLMIGDYSGASFEFVALRSRPVVSVDVGMKEINKEWKKLDIMPIEIGLRESIGCVVEPDVKKIVAAVEESLDKYINDCSAKQVIDEFMYSPEGSCGRNAANAIRKLIGTE